MDKKIQTIRMVREIRDNLYEQTKKMSRKELMEFYHAKAEKVHARLNIPVKG